VVALRPKLRREGLGTQSPDDDQVIADATTAFSALFLRISGRGPANGSIPVVPAASPFISPQNYVETYGGNGSMWLYLRNWPIVSLSSLIQPVPRTLAALPFS
jgi:hypothetical protein